VQSTASISTTRGPGNMRIRNNKIILYIGLFFFAVTPLSAAEIDFQLPQASPENVHGPFLVSALLHPDGEVVNAIQMEVRVEGSAYIEEVYDGDSVITNWVEKPHFNASNITFSGIIAGGFDGIAIPGTSNKRPGKIFDFVVYPREIGDVTVRIESAKVLLHDGKGTETIVTSNPLEVTVTSIERDTQKDYFFNDETPPELVTYNVVESDDLLSGARVLMFDVRDSESGVSYIEISENNSEYIRTDLVHSLKGDTVAVDIRMVDKAGNVATENITFEKTLIQKARDWDEAMIFILILFIMVAAILLRSLYVK
jgi:hypothetical protein